MYVMPLPLACALLVVVATRQGDRERTEVYTHMHTVLIHTMTGSNQLHNVSCPLHVHVHVQIMSK